MPILARWTGRTRGRCGPTVWIDADHRVRRTELHQAGTVLALMLLTAAALAVILAPYIRRALVGPLQALESSIKRRVAGDRDAGAPVAGTPAIQTVARALNEAAEVGVRLAPRGQQATDELLAVDRMRQALPATVSHELHTPLSSIAGYAEI